VALRPLVVCYHNVLDAWAHQLAVTPRAFERQLAALVRRGFHPIRAAEVLRRPRRGLHVTFDDAYRGVLNAVPVLERLGLHATVFVSTSFADEGGRPLDVPELADDVARHPDHLRTLTWDELRGLVERGVEIGSHTVGHPHLPGLADAELTRELTESRRRVEDELGRPCPFLAYPYGEHDARVQAAVGRAGYEAAFALWPGSSPTNRFALPRVDIYRGDSLVRAMVKTSFVKPYASAILERIRG
jgi:peptidoglycan/xylan/chitin deacetylase (PgdA/CDA1 family)